MHLLGHSCLATQDNNNYVRRVHGHLAGKAGIDFGTKSDVSPDFVSIPELGQAYIWKPLDIAGPEIYSSE